MVGAAVTQENESQKSSSGVAYLSCRCDRLTSQGAVREDLQERRWIHDAN